MSKPFLEAGHEFRDTDGTLVATLTRDVYAAEPLMLDQFEFEDGYQQNPGDIPHPAIANAVWGRRCLN